MQRLKSAPQEVATQRRAQQKVEGECTHINQVSQHINNVTSEHADNLFALVMRRITGSRRMFSLLLQHNITSKTGCIIAIYHYNTGADIFPGFHIIRTWEIMVHSGEFNSFYSAPSRFKITPRYTISSLFIGASCHKGEKQIQTDFISHQAARGVSGWFNCLNVPSVLLVCAFQSCTMCHFGLQTTCSKDDKVIIC